MQRLECGRQKVKEPWGVAEVPLEAHQEPLAKEQSNQNVRVVLRYSGGPAPRRDAVDISRARLTYWKGFTSVIKATGERGPYLGSIFTEL